MGMLSPAVEQAVGDDGARATMAYYHLLDEFQRRLSGRSLPDVVLDLHVNEWLSAALGARKRRLREPA
jgi:hypothetical protein